MTHVCRAPGKRRVPARALHLFRGAPIVLLLVPALAACVRHGDSAPPATFPALDTARMPGHPECPQLDGTYAAGADAGGHPALEGVRIADPGAAALQVTRDGAVLRFASWWTPADVRASAHDLARTEADAYARWWQAAGEVLSGTADSDAASRASSLPGPSPVRISTVMPECADGWLKSGALVDMSPTASRHGSSLLLARDTAGGLVMRNDVDVDRIEIPLWCGDGCRGVTLYARRETRWARHPPAPAPTGWQIDFAELPTPAGPDVGVSRRPAAGTGGRIEPRTKAL
jgi:hypothetical protein